MSTSNEGTVVVKRAPTKEAPEQRFRRVATGRTRQILKYLRLLGNTANQGYKHTQGEAEAIFTTLKKALTETEAKFSELHEQSFRL
jgi:hypothetical protein